MSMKIVKEGMHISYCPDCEQEIDLGARPREGQEVTCPNCGIYLEVISLDPLELDWAVSEFGEYWGPDEEEDWG
jgi:lysine biosynthesis protein LysW